MGSSGKITEDGLKCFILVGCSKVKGLFLDLLVPSVAGSPEVGTSCWFTVLSVSASLTVNGQIAS